MAKKKSGSKVGLIALLLLLVMLVLAIVGVCIDWVSVGGSALGGLVETDAEGLTLGDLFELYGESQLEIAGIFKAMASFAILTVILAAATAVVAGITKVLGWKLLKFILVIVAIVCVICGVVAIITSYNFCDQASVDVIIASGTYTPAAGLWLTAIGGILAGFIGVFAAVKN